MSSTEQSIYNEVFISYSRKNVEFARKLVKAIYDNGRENVWIDWEDIEYAEDWWHKIQIGIDSAENFLFILSPDSVQSKVCYDEVDYAVKSGKRIIPIVFKEITEKEDFEKMHPTISQHNWLPFGDEKDFDASMQVLLKTIDTDLAHVRTHTKMQTRAREWEQLGRKEAYLLTTGELEDARTWLERANDDPDKLPKPTSIQREFIAVSQIVDDDRRERERKLEERARRTRLYLGAAIPAVIGFIIASVFAVIAFQRSVTAQEQLIENTSIGLATNARFWGRNGENPLIGLSYALEANEIDGLENPPIVSQFTLAELAWQPGARRQIEGHLGEVWGVDYSPDGQYIFTGAGSFTGEPDNRLIQWDVSTGEIVREFDDHTDRIYSVAVSPDGRYIATGSQDTNVILRDFETGEVLFVLGDGVREHGVPIFNVMFTRDSTRLITGGADRIIVWNVEDGTIVNRFEGIHGDHILDMDISDDDRLVFSGSFDDSIAVWELETGQIIHTLEAGQITGARFLDTANRGATTDQDGNVIIWNLATGERIRTIEHEEAPLRGGVVVTPDGELIIAADDNGNVMMWETNGTGNAPLISFRGHNGRITSLAMHPDGLEVATVSFDYSIIVWDILGRDAEIRRYEEMEDVIIYDATMSNDGLLIASGTGDGRVIIRDANSGDLLHEIQITESNVYALSFSPDGSQLAVAGEDATVTVWNTESGELMSTYSDLQAPIRTVVFSPDGNFLAAGGGQVQVNANRPIDNRVAIWNTEGELIQTLAGHRAAVRDLAFTPDSMQLLSAGDDSEIILWNIASGDEAKRYEGHTDSVSSVSFNTDGSQFLSGSLDEHVILWNVETGEIIHRLHGHLSGVRAVAFHPDGVHAVSGAGNIDSASGLRDYELLYWDLDAGDVLREMPGHTFTVRSLMFNTEGTQILSSADDGNVILWHADTLDTLIQRTHDKYQVVCIPDAPDSECADEVDETVLDDSEETVDGQVFPIQSDTVTSYSENSLCLLPRSAEFTPPDAIVDTTEFAGDGEYVIGYSESGVQGTSDAWIAAWAEYQASQEDSVSRFVLRNANNNASQQVRDIDSLVYDEMVDVVIINPIEQAASNMTDLEETIQEVIELGIPVILVGNRTANPVYTTYVGADTYELGCVMAQELIALTGGEGSIARVHGYDLSVADASFKAGAGDVFNNYPNILFTVEGPTNYSRDTATTLTRRLRVVGILGYVSEITMGAQDGLASQGAPYATFVSDHRVDLVRLAVNNDIDGVFVRSSSQMGATAVQTAIAILQGEEVSQFVPVEPQLIHTDELVDYDLENAPANAYLGDWQDLPEEYYPVDLEARILNILYSIP